MIDFVLNDKLKSLAKKFGFNEFCFVQVVNFENLGKVKEGLKVVRADKKNLRKIFESKNVDLVVGLESVFGRDNLHYLKSGLNQVLCNLAVKNKIGVGFSFYDILESKEKDKVLGRVIQNVNLCKKYKVNFMLGSFAKEKYDLRMKKDLEAFGRLIGIDKLDNKKIFKLKEIKDIKVG
jgi:RNase P/RNase MRP subunit p30